MEEKKNDITAQRQLNQEFFCLHCKYAKEILGYYAYCGKKNNRVQMSKILNCKKFKEK